MSAIAREGLLGTVVHRYFYIILHKVQFSGKAFCYIINGLMVRNILNLICSHPNTLTGTHCHIYTETVLPVSR